MLEALRRIASKFFSGVQKETDVLQTLDNEVRAALARLDERDPGLRKFLDGAYAYAIFPSVGKASAVIGGAFGKGEVFQGGRLVGYAAVAQLTVGVQVGGDTFAQVIAFESKPALDRFKQGKFAFAANASAVLVKAGAAATADYESGVAVFAYAEGGMLLEAAVGGQKFFFRHAVLGRTKKAPRPAPSSQAARTGKTKTPKRAATRGRKTATNNNGQGKRRGAPSTASRGTGRSGPPRATSRRSAVASKKG
jgi:lipid-binding SYLF domain-containing protein